MILRYSLLRRNVAEHAALLFVVASHVYKDDSRSISVTRESAFFRSLLGDLFARRQRAKIAGLLQWSECEVTIAILTDDDSPMHLIGTQAWIERAVLAEGKRQGVVGRINFYARPGSICAYGVGIGACGIRSAADDDRLGEELDAEACRGGEDAVHTNAGRGGRTFVSIVEQGFEQVGLHRLDTNAGAF